MLHVKNIACILVFQHYKYLTSIHNLFRKCTSLSCLLSLTRNSNLFFLYVLQCGVVVLSLNVIHFALFSLTYMCVDVGVRKARDSAVVTYQFTIALAQHFLCVTATFCLIFVVVCTICHG